MVFVRGPSKGVACNEGCRQDADWLIMARQAGDSITKTLLVWSIVVLGHVDLAPFSRRGGGSDGDASSTESRQELMKAREVVSGLVIVET